MKKKENKYIVRYNIFKFIVGLIVGFNLLFLVKDFTIGRVIFILSLFGFLYYVYRQIKRGTEYFTGKRKEEPRGLFESFFGVEK